VPTTQLFFGTWLVLILLMVAGVTAWRQLAILRGQGDPSEEQHYQLGRARRRLFSSAVMFLLALLLAGALIFLEAPAQQLADSIDHHGIGEVEKPENKEFARFYGWYWVLFMLLLLLLLVVAGVDLWVVRRHGQRQMRRLQDDRRAMIERQAALLREERRRQDE